MLAQKLQNDRTKQAAAVQLQAACAQQIQDLHTIFVQWFRGTRPLDVLKRELKQRLTMQFSHVAPNGQFLSGRQVLLGHLTDKYACYQERVFDIEIYNIKVIWQDENKCLVTYEEWQSWQQPQSPGDEDTNSTSDQQQQQQVMETQRFGRLSTCLLEKTEPSYKWIHVHETWLEEEEPAPDAVKAQDMITMAATAEKEDDSIMTGPVLPPSDHAKKTTTANGNSNLSRTLNLGGAATGAAAGAAAAIAMGRGNDNDDDEEETATEEPSLRHPFENGLCQVVVLVSKTTQASNLHQQEALQILQQQGISYSTVDGSDPKQRHRRNALFRVSGKPGLYPQFFLTNGETDSEHEKTLYWGDWERFQQVAERGSLAAEMFASPSGDEHKKGNDNDDDDDSDDDDSDHQGLAAVAMGGAVAAVGSKKSGVDKMNDAPDWALTASEHNGRDFSETQAVQEEEDDDDDDDSEGAAAGADAGGKDEKTADTVESVDELSPEEMEFLEASKGILVFEEEEESQRSERPEDGDDEQDDQEDPAEEKSGADKAPSTPAQTPIPNDVSAKRHVSPKLKKYAKPMMWQGTMVGISVAGFDIGTSQGPIADETWYKENGARIEDMAQSINHSKPRRRICLPEMVYPVAHVALEGNGVWLSWDATDALESWAKCHQMISVLSRIGWNGVNVIRSSDAKKWEDKRLHVSAEEAHAAVFHYDWTYATPYCGTMQGGEWVELDESGMRMELLKDQSVPILFFDEVILYEDDLHDNGQCQYAIKMRVMPTCAYVLARLWVRVDKIIVRLRETRVLIDFFGMKPQIYRDVTWRECAWEKLKEHNLPTDVRSWQHDGPETPAWNMQLQMIPEVEPPKDVIQKHAILEYSGGGANAPFEC